MKPRWTASRVPTAKSRPSGLEESLVREVWRVNHGLDLEGSPEEPGEPPSAYGEEPTIGFGTEPGAAGAGEAGTVAEVGAGERAAESAGVLGGLGAEAILPVALAGAAGVAAGTGMAELADSSLTKTGAFGTNPDTGQNQSAMDWGASWGTDWDKAHNQGQPSITGGVLAGLGGIVGGIGGAGYGAYKWLQNQF